MTHHIIMLASENDALIRGKVGGVGDVLRDLPAALAGLGHRVTVITPSYGFLHTENPTRRLTTVSFPFGGKEQLGELYEATPKLPVKGVTNLLFEHPAIRGTPIYTNDPPAHPFAQDATKYALFCSAIGQYLKLVSGPFLLHLHDWHTPTLLFLRERHPRFAHLRGVRSAFTIHNVAIQGNRPIQGPSASVEQWFPELFEETSWINAWADRRFREPNFTPMAIGIRCADMVNTVSPTYAREILHPSDPANGLYRGEGLEGELREIDRRGKLLGILNGCDYPEGRSVGTMNRRELLELMAGEVEGWQAEPLLAQIRSLQALAPTVLLTSVTRIVEQKLKILFQTTSRGIQAIKELLDLLEEVNGMYVIIGTGVSEYEALLASTAGAHRRLLYLQGYSETIARALYANGTAFLMPSSFEPCGIGQMIAMRDGQPCIVHAVGGLKDTVIDGVNGFTFSGATLREQADDCVATVTRAIGMARNNAEGWSRIVEGARTSRFTWAMSAQRYSESMYG